MRKIFLSLIICCTILPLSGQQYPCSLDYKHLLGERGQTEAILDLVISNGVINGSCVFSEERFSDGKLEGLIKTERLEGNVDNHGVATITAYEQNIVVGTYTGVLGEEFKGTFREQGNNKSQTFNFQEYYKEFSVPFSAYCRSQDSLLLDSVSVLFAHLEYNLLLPPEKTKFDMIRAAIMKAFIGKSIPLNTPGDSILYYSAMEYFGKYVNGNRDLYDGGLSFNWESIKSGYIGMNHYGLLVYRMESYGYTGGAHGMGASSFLVIDTESMTEIGLDDIFIPEYEEQLMQLLERSFRINYFVEPEQSLTEAGLFENEIPPTKNFFLTENSIGFYYNPYHLAPYAMGAQVISLRWDEVEHLIREDAVVRKLLK